MRSGKKLKIGIDASCILPRKTGIGNFTDNLLRELLHLETEHEFVIFLNSFSNPAENLPVSQSPRIKVKKYKIPGPLLVYSWRYVKFPPIEFLTGLTDIFHSTSGYFPPQIRGKRVVTVYDLFFLRHPELCDKLGGRFFAKTFPRRLHKFDQIIVPSNATKHDIRESLDIPEEKITVIYGGVDQERFHVIKDLELLNSIRREYCLPQHYILSVSTLEPRKNLDGLLIAYKHLKDILYNPPKLVLVGGKGWEQQDLRKLVRQHRLMQDVIFTGYVPARHLPLIYNAALAFAMPSLWEGFGMPVLEAMACGIPCLISNTPALKEISEDAALSADPYNYYEIAEKLKDLITSHKLRDQMSQKGLSVITKFTWKLTAKKTLRLYEKIMER